MAPTLLEHPPMLPEYFHAKSMPIKSIPICSDPSVTVSESAPKQSKQRWWLHGHPHSKRYSNPELTNFGALVRYDGDIYRGQKGFLYPVSDTPSTPYKSMTWGEFDRVTEAIALSYAKKLKDELETGNNTQKQPTIGLIGRGTTIEYFCTQLALQKLGVRVLLLAESNAQNALYHLLESCKALAVITDSRNTSIDTNGIRKLTMMETLPSPLGVRGAVERLKFQDFGDVWERHSFIIHSSGSTGMPKPVIHTNRSMMLIARMYRLFPSFDVNNWFLLFPL